MVEFYLRINISVLEISMKIASQHAVAGTFFFFCIPDLSGVDELH